MHLVLACCCFLVDCMYMTSNSAIRYGPDQQVLFCSRAKSCHPGFAVLASAEMLRLWPWELRTELHRYFSTPVGYHHRQCSLPNTLLNFLGFWMSMQSTLGKNSLQDACGCFDSPPAIRFAMAVNCTQPSNLSPFLS